MKKISLFLFATIFGLTAMAQLNPYAYGLSSNWDPTTQTLTVDFKLNAKAKKIEIFAVDRSNSNKRYKIHEITSPGNTLDYSIPIHINGKDKDGTCLPVGKNLTFAVKVDGDARNTPGDPVYTSSRPYSPHGVAVNNCQNSQDFGAVYVTECTNGVSGNTWGWLSGKGQSLLEYDPQMKYVVSHQKSSPFSQRNFKSRLLEPHRVRVSDDGDVYVSSYNIQSSNSTPVVWKYNKTTNDFDPVINHNTSYGDRVFGMAVRGSGSATTILLLYLEENTGQSLKQEFRVYEYSLNNLGANKNVASSKKCWYTPGSGGQTIMTYWTQNLSGQTSPYYVYSEGFANVAYRANSSNDVFFMLDYFYDQTWNARMVYYQGQNPVSYQTLNKDGHYYGGGSLLTYKYNNVEYIVSGRTSKNGYSGYYNQPDDGRINVYKFDPTLTGNNNNDKIASNCTYTISTRTASVINDFAMDCANNLYAVSSTDATGENGYDSNKGKCPTGTGNLLAVPMPYSGTVTTYCPTSNTDVKEYFQLPARTNLTEEISETDFNRIVENNSGGCGCDISLDRPMQANMYNTICLPFDLNVNNLATNHPYYNATVLAFDGVTISTSNNESVLELNFVSTNGVIEKNTPYLIQPQNDIPNEVTFDNVMLYEYTGFDDQDPTYKVTQNNITFWGIIPQSIISATDPENEVVLILVADNRLANVTKKGTYRGFRGFFYFDRSNVPANVVARIAERKPTPTSIINLNGTQVDVEKFLREGRVYIRLGEALYTLDGQKVE